LKQLVIIHKGEDDLTLFWLHSHVLDNFW